MKYHNPCYQQLHFVFKMGSIESLASATCHDQSGRGRAHISEVGPKNGWEKEKDAMIIVLGTLPASCQLEPYFAQALHQIF